MTKRDIKEIEFELRGPGTLTVFCFDCNGPTEAITTTHLRCKHCGAEWEVEIEARPAGGR